MNNHTLNYQSAGGKITYIFPKDSERLVPVEVDLARLLTRTENPLLPLGRSAEGVSQSERIEEGLRLKRVATQFKSGQVEMPHVGLLPSGQSKTIDGRHRLDHAAKMGETTAWVLVAPDTAEAFSQAFGKDEQTPQPRRGWFSLS